MNSVYFLPRPPKAVSRLSLDWTSHHDKGRGKWLRRSLVGSLSRDGVLRDLADMGTTLVGADVKRGTPAYM